MNRVSKGLASELDSAGALMFLAIALLGMYFGSGFFVNFIQKNSPGQDFALLSAGTIPLSNIAIAMKVGSCLFMANVNEPYVLIKTTLEDRFHVAAGQCENTLYAFFFERLN